MRYAADRIKLPEFLSAQFICTGIRKVDVGKLYVCLKLPAGRRLYGSIYDTPHYHFAKKALSSGEFGSQGETGAFTYKGYREYSEQHADACSEADFLDLVKSIRVKGYDCGSTPVLVFRHWKRLLPVGRWDVADGFHRLAVLSAMGETEVPVGTLANRHGVLQRVGRLLSNPQKNKGASS